jgi:arsenate reductase
LESRGRERSSLSRRQSLAATDGASRAAKALLDERKVACEGRRYLEKPLSAPELAELRCRLDRPRANGCAPARISSRRPACRRTRGDKEILAAMAKHPILIERPIPILGTRAAVGRPAENIEALLAEMD